MKALTYNKAHSLEDFSIKSTEVPMPEASGFDVLVNIKAISINPVDYKIRSSRSSDGSGPVILGWDASGVITEVGEKVTNFKAGDEVYYAGDLNRQGSYAEFQLVDSRLIALKPDTLSFSEAAAMPLTSLTAYEALIEKNLGLGPSSKVLIIGGAGGVGSISTQILKALTPVKVIATASRPETTDWCKKMGADIVIDHKRNLSEELLKHDIKDVDVVFSTTYTENYLKIIPELLRPFGHFILVDDPKSLDVILFKGKAISIHWELMFTKTLYNYDIASQGEILKKMAELIEKGKISTTLNNTFKGFKPENIKAAHELAEKGVSVGKIVVEF